MSDSEQYSNRRQPNLISLLINFACELGQIMTIYTFIWTRKVILSNVQAYSKLDLMSLVNFVYELGQIMTDMTSYELDE